MLDRLISIILPVYNQADHIEQVVAGYEEVLLRVPLPHELVLVVNNCRDASLEVCRRLEDKYRPVRVMHCKRDGWGHAVRAGLKDSKGSLLCYTNSARTSPGDLALLLLYAVAYPDVIVKANRKVRDNWRRRAGSLLFNLECRALFDLSNWDINGTPKVFPRKLKKLLELTRDDDLIDLEFLVVCRREGYPVIEVPVLSTRRSGGRSTTNYKSAIKMYVGAYRLWWSHRGDN